MEYKDTTTNLNILFNNNLASDSWNKRMSCEQCDPIKSPSDSRHDVVTVKSMTSKIFIFSYEDNAPLVNNKEYQFTIFVNVDTRDESEYSPLLVPSEPNPLYSEEYYLDRNINLESIASTTNVTAETYSSTISMTTGLKKKKQKPVQIALFKGRYFNEHNILTDFKSPSVTEQWTKLIWNFKVNSSSEKSSSTGHLETVGNSNSQRISFYIKHAENKTISLWKPELFCTSGIYDPETYKNFDFFKYSINLFNEYKNTCVNIYSNQTKSPNAGFLIGNKYVCSVYNKDQKEPIYAQLFPNGNIVPTKLIGIDPVLNISVYEIPESSRVNNFLIVEQNNSVQKTLLVCTINRQYATCKHQITPGFVTNVLNTLDVNDGLFQTTFEQTKTSVGQPILNPNGELVGMISYFSKNGSHALCLNVNLMHKICSRIIRAYESNPNNIPLELNGGFLGISYHLCDPAEKNNLKIQEREGFILDKIYPNSPADKIGLKEGDVIFNFSKNNTPVLLGPSFFEYIYAKKVDSSVCMEYSKNYNTKEKIPIEIRLESRRKYPNVPANFL